MNLAALIQAFIDGAVEQNGLLTQAGLTKLNTFFGTMGKLRIFVCNAAGFGHQANTITVMRRLIALGATKPIQLIYDADTGETMMTIDKLAILLPGLDPKNPQQILVDNVPVTFFPYKANKPIVGLDDSQPICITGGADLNVNLTAVFNVDHYLQLQPFMWGKSKNLLWARDAQQAVDLTEVESLKPKFIQRAFVMNDPTLTAEDWTNLAKVPNIDLAMLARAQAVLTLATPQNQAQFVPVYGLPEPGGGHLAVPGAAKNIAFMEIAAIALAQRKASSPLARKTIVALLSQLADDVWSSLEFGFSKPEQKEQKSGDSDDDEDPPIPEKAQKWAWEQFGGKVHVKRGISAEALTTLFSEIGPDEIVIVDLLRTPQILFNYLYSQSTLPSVFEGQATANLALNLGKPYFQMTKGSNIPYPVLPFGSDVSNATQKKISDTVALLQYGIYDPAADAAKIADLMIASMTGASDLNTYYASLRTFYHADVNDKLLLALLYWQAGLAVQQVHQLVAFAAADAGPLDQLDTTLNEHVQGGVLNLIPGSLSSGSAFQYLTLINGGQPINVGTAALPVTIDFPDPKTAIKVAGSAALLATQLDFEADFALDSPTATTIRTSLTLSIPGNFSLPQIPWFALADVTIAAIIPGNGERLSGSTSATLKLGGKPVPLTADFPSGTDKMLLTGDLSALPLSVSDLFGTLGGINFVPTLPGPLQAAANISLKTVSFDYDFTASAIDAFNVELATSQPWPLFGKLTLAALDVTVMVADPTGARSVSWNAASSFGIGDGTIDVGISYPNLTITGMIAEDSEPIALSDFLTFFLPPSITVPVSGDLTALSLMVQPGPPLIYAASCAIATDWPITILGTTIFTITGLGFAVNGSGSAAPTGNVTGSITILPDDPDVSLQLTLSAAKQADGWLFSAQQAGGALPLGKLIKTYLHWDLGSGSDYSIDGLGLTITTSDNSWSFTGKTAQPWTVPFISGLSVSASLTAGWNASTNGALALPTVARSSAAIALAAEDGDGGYFGRVETEWTWENIDLILYFDYAPDKRSFGITWGLLEGKVEGPDGNGDYTATLKFTEGTTLGSMIETMVSWATGSRFSLGSPWDLLDSIPLSKLALVYTFNTSDKSRNHVSLQVDIGPIELGFARIDSIGLSYNSTGTGDEKGVMVTLNGSFFWQDNPSEPLQWDATKPETTPAPSGNGNKYFDLRMLAMGQHVTVPGFAQAQTVQAAVALMGTFPDPSGDDPQLPPPPVVFDAASDWLVGLDIGLLKIGGDSEGGNGGTALALRPASALAAQDDGDGYVVTLQIVFNDPALYGLRLALAGDAAKIFKGLDFQIMYRQISPTVGVYEAEITLPDVMRYLTIGAYSITLPVFAIQVYTNGDFQVDVGFPWNADFSRSFTIEAIIPPGIPVIGSAGFYFGKLSSATTNRVPAATNGTFNPVIVFGFGMQIGFGKSIHYGILSAGFSVTAVGIIEGVIGKWNPYQIGQAGGQPPAQVQGEYYFWLQGTVGVVGQVFGSVDFAIIKADVNITVKLLLQLTYESFTAVTISVIASVSVSVSVKIDLGLFSITIHFSFSMTLKETFSIPASGTAPWIAPSEPAGMLRGPAERRLRAMASPLALAAMAETVPNWSNLLQGDTISLTGYFAPALTAARDEWGSTALTDQLPCYVALLLIDAPAPADGSGNAAAPTSFEALAAMVLRWAVAAIHGAPIAPSDVDKLVIDGTYLDRLANEVLVSNDANPTPIGPDDVGTFLANQFALAITAPDQTVAQSVNAAYFPVPPELTLTVPAYGAAYPGCSYSFGAYNALDSTVLGNLRSYFDQLAVKVQQESGQPSRLAATASAPLSAAAWIYADYFLLIARQMVKTVQEGLRNFQYPIASGDTGNSIVVWVNTLAGLSGATAYALYDLFASNAAHPLAGGMPLTIGVTGSAAEVDSFETLATRFAQPPLTGTALAAANAALPGILNTGTVVTLPSGASYATGAQDSLFDIAAKLGTPQAPVSLGSLLSSSGLLSKTGAISSSAALLFPFVTVGAAIGDSFNSIAGAAVWGGAVSGTALATVNAGRNVLRAGATINYTGGTPTKHVVAAGETLGDIANALGVPLADLLANSDTLTGNSLLNPATPLAVPALVSQTLAGDTLQQVATRFGVDVGVLADQPSNGDIANLFATVASDAARTPAPTLNLAHLPCFPVGQLLAEAQSSGALQHLSGMVSRYMLHGMRLPTAGITPKAAGMWVKSVGSVLTLPPQAGVYALTGQQIPLPTLGSASFSLSLDRSAGPAWLTFPGAANPNLLTLTIAPNTDPAARITAVANYAQGNRLAIALDQLGAGEMYDAELASYPFSSATAWASAGAVTMPYGPPPGGVQALRLWGLPNAMAGLPDPAARSVDPRFTLKVARFDEATGRTVEQPAGSWGWASAISFTVKHIPGDITKPPAAVTYEVVGATGNDTVLLERMVAQIEGHDASFASLGLAFAQDGSGGGLVSDAVAALTFGIAQVNLSTETHPPSGLAMAMAVAASDSGMGLLNSPSDFVRLLWEASITRSGGFYLYYYDAADARGLPDRLFNDRGEAQLNLIVLYAPRGGTASGRVANYMNAAVTADAAAGEGALFAKADPSPVMIGTPLTVANASLQGLAAAYNLDAADLAVINAGVTLGPVQIDVSAGRYSAPPGGIPLATIASNYGTTVTALIDSNPAWDDGLPDPLPFPAQIALPALTLSVGSSPHTASLQDVADYYGEPLAALAAENGTLPGLFAGAILIDQDGLEDASLASLAYAYFDDPADVADANADVPLAAVTLKVSEGVAQAPPGGIALDTFAENYGSSVAALNEANPDWSGGLPDPLPFPAAIRLPPLKLAGGSAHAGSLGEISDFYGQPLGALAAENCTVTGLFAGKAVIVRGGPDVRAASVPPGVQAVAAQRPVPPAVPAQGSDANFGQYYLLNAFSLLNQRILLNQDFIGSNQGLPAGPTTSAGAAGPPTKMVGAVAEADVSEWDYSSSLPYFRFSSATRAPTGAGLPDPAQNPYVAVGRLLQIWFDWQDQFGNSLITTLSEPQARDAGPYNASPLPTGYTDPIIAVGQWPSVAGSWQVVGTPGNAQIELDFAFDPSRYEGLLYAQATGASTLTAYFTGPLDPATAADPTKYQLLPGSLQPSTATPSQDGLSVALVFADPIGDGATLMISSLAWADKTSFGGQALVAPADDLSLRTSSAQQAAATALATYTTLYYQLADPNGLALSIDTSLLTAGVPLAMASVTDWLFGTGSGSSVFTFLQDRAGFGTAVQAPTAPLSVQIPIDQQELNPGQIFELFLEIGMRRTGGTVLGGLETTSGIRSAATRIAPAQAKTDQGSKTLALTAFADNLQQALATSDQLVKVATGANLAGASAVSGSTTLWVVRLGLNAQEPISYAVGPASTANPVILAPRPVSNTLQSHPSVPIYDYVTGQGLGTTARPVDFVDIDLDGWCAQIFASIDAVLTPTFTGPMQILGSLDNDTRYLDLALKAKVSIAQIASELMIPVFADAPVDFDPSDAREAFRQQLLSELSNTYSVRAAVQYGITVNADVGETIPPRLFGAVEAPRPGFEWAYAEVGAATIVYLDFTDALDPDSAKVAANYVFTDNIQVMAVEVDARRVTLTVSKAVTGGTTTVTVQNLMDTGKVTLIGLLTRVVMASALDRPPIGLSSPKLNLATGDNPLIFLVSAPADSRSAQGDIESHVDLDLVYRGSQIEHQIGAVPGIAGYQASTWLSFVTPAPRGAPGDPLTAPLTAPGSPLQVPMVLRAFPATPTMAAQEGPASFQISSASTADLAEVVKWDYRMIYSLPYHFEQDRIYGTVQFNLTPPTMMLGGFEDSFNALAEFVTVFDAVHADLITYLAPIDATVDPVKDKDNIDKARAALQAFLQLAAGVAGSDEAPTTLAFAAPRRRLMGAPDLTYTFQIDEGHATAPDGEQTLMITLNGALAPGMPTIPLPFVQVGDDSFQPVFQASQSSATSFVYFYQNPTSQLYLAPEAGRETPERTLVLPQLDILQRQDAWAQVFLKRNVELVPDRPSADPFVYTTPQVSFSSPLFPTNDSDAQINIALVGAPNPPTPAVRSIEQHLTALFTALLAQNQQPGLTIQIEASYGYPFNPGLSDVMLPAFFQSPLVATLEGGTVKIPAQMISAWAAALALWFQQQQPKGQGTLWFDLAIMSDLTSQPMPLLRLRKLYLDLANVQPQPAQLAAGQRTPQAVE